jgi:hypothetical protein
MRREADTKRRLLCERRQLTAVVDNGQEKGDAS